MPRFREQTIIHLDGADYRRAGPVQVWTLVDLFFSPELNITIICASVLMLLGVQHINCVQVQ